MYSPEQSNFMESKPVPELKVQIEAAAKDLAVSQEDSLEIKGADNKILVKAGSPTAEKMLSEERILFPMKIADKDYLVCIKEVR
jgi:hypothetical protein